MAQEPFEGSTLPKEGLARPESTKAEIASLDHGGDVPSLKFVRKKPSETSEPVPEMHGDKPWIMSDHPPEEQAKWVEFSRENPDGGLDEIDIIDPGTYFPLPKSWVPGKSKVEYGQQLLQRAQEIREKIDEQFGSKIPSDCSVNAPFVHYLREEINLRVATQKVQVYENGRCLCLAKQALGYKKFGEWLKTVDIHRTSAHNSMRVYRTVAGCPELLEGLSAVQMYTLCSPAFPKALRDMIFDRKPNNLPKYAKAIARLGEQYKNSPLPLEVPDIKALFDRRAHRLAYRKMERELRAIWRFLDTEIRRLKTISNVDRPEAYCRTDEEKKCYGELISLLKRFVLKLEDYQMKFSWAADRADDEDDLDDDPTEKETDATE
jgi:hypothetical protein